MKKAVIIGASEGIGRALARLYAGEGYAVGIAARRTELLDSLKAELSGAVYTMPMDVTQTDEAVARFHQLVGAMGGADIVIICAGTGFVNPELQWPLEAATLDVNVKGFTAIADAAFLYLARQKTGCLAGVSSVAAIRGNAVSPAYNASKAYVSNYLEGLRCKAAKISRELCVCDIRPGFVDTKMAQGEGIFWMVSPEKAAETIAAIIRRKKRVGYVTRRWALIALLFRIMPHGLLEKLG